MARCRVMLINFKESGGKVNLDYSLTRCLVDFDNHQSKELVINLSNGVVKLNKAEYLNTGKVYFDGRVFFIVATKWMAKKHALKVLLSFAVERLQNRLSIYRKLLAA